MPQSIYGTTSSAGTYTCVLQGTAYSSLPGSYHLTAIAGSTWLDADETNRTGARWWQNPACESDDRARDCTYVGGGAAHPAAWAFTTTEPRSTSDRRTRMR